ncbi:hypothetical protein Tco_0277845 [Tanacetum coccineum]
MNYLEYLGQDLVDANQALEERLDKHGSRLYKLENQDIPNQVSKAVDEIVTNAVDWAMQAPLRERFRDLPEADMKEILHNRMWESKSYQTHEDHMTLYEALEKSMARDNRDHLLSDLAEARKNKKKRQGSPKTPSGSPPHPSPPPPPPAGPSGTSGASGASGSYQSPPPPPPPSNTQGDQPATPEPAWSIPLSDLTVPTNNCASALKSTYTPLPENSLLAQIGDMATFMDWYCKKQGISELTQKDLEGPTYKIVKVFHPDVVHLQFQMEECHKLLTDQVDDAILRPALSILKMKAAYYPDAGLEQMVPDQMWIEEECKYDVAAMYGISHWWFQRQWFYIDRHTLIGLLNHLSTRRQKDSHYCCQLIDQKLGYLDKRRKYVLLGIKRLTRRRPSPFRDKYWGSDDHEGQQEESEFGYTVLDEE